MAWGLCGAPPFRARRVRANPGDPVGQLPILGEMAYIGGDAIAFLSYSGNSFQLEIMHASVIGSPP